MADIKNSLDFEKSYAFNGPQKTQDVAYALAQYLDTEKNMVTQTMHQPDGYLVQCKGDLNAEWTKYLGMDASITIELKEKDGRLYVKVGSGKWIQKLGIAAAGALWFTPLALTAGIGAARQTFIQQEIFDFISHYLGVEAESVSSPLDGAFRAFDSEVRSSVRTCPNCGASVKEDDAFCAKCGTKLEVEEEVHHCAHCGAELEGTETFCPKCGNKI